MASTLALRFVLLSCALLVDLSDALAQQPSGEARVLQLRKQAEEHEKQKQYLACAETYLSIYQELPESNRIDQVLYNAGVCFEEAGLVGRAIEAYEGVLDKAPKSRLAMRARVRIGSAAASIAQFDKSAQAYEGFARRYAGEKEAPNAIRIATTYRKALGHKKQAIANLESYLRNYGRKRIEESADAYLTLGAIYESEGNTKQMVRTYKDYLRRIGKRGGPHRLVVVNAKIGVALWEQSCATKGDDNSCAKVVRHPRPALKGKQPTQCGPTKTVIRVRPRAKGAAKEAREYLERAAALYERSLKRSAAQDWGAQRAEEEEAQAKAWAAAARFHSLQGDFETLLAERFPRNLDFAAGTQKRQDSERRFVDWIASLREQIKSLNESYSELALEGSGVWRVAAAARSAQSSQHFANLLTGAAIPASIRTGPYAEDGVNAYCSALTSASVPLEEQAVTAYAHCLKLSQSLDHFDSWSRLCERELGMLRPDAFPEARELRGPSTELAPLLSLTPLLSSRTEPSLTVQPGSAD